MAVAVHRLLEQGGKRILEQGGGHRIVEQSEGDTDNDALSLANRPTGKRAIIAQLRRGR